MELLLPSAKVILKLLFSIFTFQYGATATELCVLLNIKPTTFTFQYGATATYRLFTGLQNVIRFTFQYGATATNSNIFSNSISYHIYIPIWSYCYEVREEMKLNGYKIYIPIWSYCYLYIYWPNY